MPRPRRYQGLNITSFYWPVELKLSEHFRSLMLATGQKQNDIILEAICNYLKEHRSDHPDLLTEAQLEIEAIKKLELNLDVDDLKTLLDSIEQKHGTKEYQRSLRDRAKRALIRIKKANVYI